MRHLREFDEWNPDDWDEKSFDMEKSDMENVGFEPAGRDLVSDGVSADIRIEINHGVLDNQERTSFAYFFIKEPYSKKYLMERGDDECKKLIERGYIIDNHQNNEDKEEPDSFGLIGIYSECDFGEIHLEKNQLDKLGDLLESLENSVSIEPKKIKSGYHIIAEETGTANSLINDFLNEVGGYDKMAPTGIYGGYTIDLFDPKDPENSNPVSPRKTEEVLIENPDISPEDFSKYGIEKELWKDNLVLNDLNVDYIHIDLDISIKTRSGKIREFKISTSADGV